MDEKIRIPKWARIEHQDLIKRIRQEAESYRGMSMGRSQELLTAALLEQIADKCEYLKSQNAILREALEFYGNILNYDKDGVIEVLGRTCHSNMVWRDSDKGKVARNALNNIKQMEVK